MEVPDQRRSRRFELRLPFLLVRAGPRHVNAAGETENLSSAGVLFTSDHDIEIGDPIEYSISLPGDADHKDGVKLHCVGKVVRKHEQLGDPDTEKPTTIAATLERYRFVRPED